MDQAIRDALAKDRMIDITTIGRASNQPRRIEIWFHNIDGRIYITGSPGKRDWYANLQTNPAFIFHLKESLQADLAAQAVPIVDPEAKLTVLTIITQRVGREADLATWVAQSPLVEVLFAD
jgi:hypothetical protein